MSLFVIIFVKDLPLTYKISIQFMSFTVGEVEIEAVNADFSSFFFHRQLPMMAAILQGRAQYTFAELKHRNHLLLYTHVLGILELLQPALFHQRFSKPLSQLLEAFFQLVKVRDMY